MTALKNCLLIDLDGTVREPLSGAKFINEPTDQRLIEGVPETVFNWHKRGWVLYGVTNQKGVLCGHKSIDSMIAEQRRTMELLPWIQIVFACPDEGRSCYRITKKSVDSIHQLELNACWQGRFRKPEPGMLMAAVHEHADPSDEALKTVMVGDRPEDKQAAERALIPFLSAEDWRAGKWLEL